VGLGEQDGVVEVPQPRLQQLGQARALQHRPGRQPGEQARRQHVQPEQIVIERQPEQGQKHDVRHRDSGINGNLANRQRHRQPEIVQLVKPFLDPPDACIGGQLHQSSLPRADAEVSERPAPSRSWYQGSHHAWVVEGHGDRDGKHDELHEADDLPGEQEEQRHDADDPKEQRAK
jgi:hypothetical protein